MSTRQLAQMKLRPGMIELGFGQPDPALLPAAELGRIRRAGPALSGGLPRATRRTASWLGRIYATVV